MPHEAKLNDVFGSQTAIAALIILNGPKLDYDLLSLVWPATTEVKASPVICADGGANLLFDLVQMEYRNSTAIALADLNNYVPTHIVGDLDSLRTDVRESYEARGTHIVEESSQDLNDFQKAVALCARLSTRKKSAIVVIGGHGGRMDQTLGNLNTLYCAAENDLDMYWLEKSNAILALSKGKHHVSIDASREGPTCGLVPVGKAVKTVSTEGLKWNLDSAALSFGSTGLISTSNEIIEQDVTVDTSEPLLWTTELRL